MNADAEKTTRRTDTASRVVPATPEAVYRAFAEPDALMAWLPPASMTGRALEYDFSEGGRYRIELTYAEDSSDGEGKTSARTDVSRGNFVSLEPGNRVVQSVEFESDDAAFAGVMMMSWTFEAVSEGTLVTITAENVPAGISQEDHHAGLRGSLENLARYVGASHGR